MPFRFYIDSQLVDQPQGDKSLQTTIKRDSDMGALTITQDVELTWTKENLLASGEVSGYTLIKTMFDAGICDEAEVVIYDEIDQTTTELVFRGVIKIPDVQWNQQRNSLKTKVRDNSFYSYVFNNRNVVFTLHSTKTKNGEQITPCPIYEVDLFSSQTGIYGSSIGQYFRGHRLYDVFRYIVPAMTDNRVTFESFFLQQLTYDLFLFDGFALLNPNTDPDVQVSFADLFSEIDKLRNVSFFIDMSDPLAPVLRLEQRDFFFSGVNVYQFTELKEITTTIRPDKLYGTVKVGADYNPGGAAGVYTFNSGTSYFGWKEEVYTPLGQCNTGVEYDLMNGFYISSNSINDQLVGLTSGNEDQVFIIQCENTDTVNLTANAYRWDFFTPGPPYYYNLGLNNITKLQEHGNNFQAVLSNTQEIGGNGFKASLGQDDFILSGNPASPVFTPSLTEPVIFADELTGSNYDGSGNYNNLTGIYTVPVDGTYSFNTNVLMDVSNLKSCSGATVTVVSSTIGVPAGSYVTTVYYGVRMTVSIIAYTDGTLTTVVAQADKVNYTITNGSYYAVNVNFGAILSAGNVVVVAISGEITRAALIPGYSIPVLLGTAYGVTANVSGCTYSATEPKITVTALEASTFECNGTPDGGIVISGNNPDAYKAYQHEFIYDIPESDWRSIQLNPTGMFEFTKDGLTVSGYIDEMQHNNQTGRTRIKLITTNATS